MKELVLNGSQTIAVVTNGQLLLSDMLVPHGGEAPRGNTKEKVFTVSGKNSSRGLCQSRVMCS